MGADRESFEIQVSKDGRWSTETIAYKDAEARALAKKFLADKTCEGARIVRNWLRADGTMVETEVFKETRTVADDGPVHIVPIDSAPEVCETPEEFMGPQSRGAINRVLRNYLDKAILTPTELMHNFKELKRLEDKDNLLTSAVDRVALLQTKDTEQDARSRGQELHHTIDDVAARARRVEGMKLPKLEGRFSEVVAQLSASGDGGEEVDYLAMVVLSRDLINVRNWVGKLERLCKLAVEDSDPHAIEMLDGVIADVLGSPVVQDVLGWQPGLGAAICAMFDLADGKLVIGKSEAGESAEILNGLFAAHKLPISRTCLLDRAHRQIRSPNPLYRNEEGKEREEFKKLVARTLVPTGLIGGPDTAEALTTRFGRMVEQGGAAGRKAAIDGTFRTMPDLATGLIYLCDLAGSNLAKDHIHDIAELLELVFRARRIGDLCEHGLPPKDRMIRATLAHRVATASVLPGPVKTRIADHVDDILDRYLVEEEIIEKLDNPESHLRDRAGRLVQFCAAGVMPEGKAMTRARQRILSLLRQPNFDAHFIDGFTDPDKAQKALRDFHHLLVKAGFG